MKLAIVAGEKARREPQENPGVARSLRFLQGALLPASQNALFLFKSQAY
jgi:hypothetical protein